MTAISTDLRTAFKSLVRRPGFAALAVTIVAVGIGCNAALFTVVESVLLRPLPWDEPESLALIWNGSGQGEEVAFSPAELRDLRRGSEELGGWEYRGETLVLDDRSRLLWSAGVTRDLFPLLGARARLGRTFTADDFAGSGAPVAVLSHGLWKEELGADPEVVGRSVLVDGEPLEVVGVLPEDFVLPTDYRWTGETELYRPFPLTAPEAAGRQHRTLWAVARLTPGAGAGALAAELDAALAERRRRHPDEYPGTEPWSVRLVPVEEEILGGVRPALFALAGAVGLVLLIVCANVASLMLVRFDARRREMAVRTALGAGQWGVCRLLLVESLLLGLAGGALGLLLADWAVSTAVALAPDELPRLEEATVGGSTVLVAVALAVGAALLFGLAPVLRVSRGNLNLALRSGGRSIVGGNERETWGWTLVVAEVALAVTLLVGAGLLLRSVAELRQVDLGFEAGTVVTGDLRPSPDRYPGDTEILSFYERLLREVRALPEVESAAVTTSVPFWNPASLALVEPVEVEGLPETREDPPNAALEVASPGIFETLGVEVVRGRGLEQRDRAGSALVALVDRRFAERFAREGDLIGSRIRLAGRQGAPWIRVVGVTEEVRDLAVERAGPPRIFLPHEQAPAHLGAAARYMGLMVRTAGEPAAVIPALRAAVAGIDRELPLGNARPLAAHLDDALSRYRFSTSLLVVFAVIAAALAVLGVYGVLSHTFARRVPEIGIRMVLGAGTRQVVRLVTARGLLLVGAGLVVGLVAAAGLTRFLASLLFEVSPFDPWAFLLAGAVLGLSVLAAVSVPARRAARLDPAATLRRD